MISLDENLIQNVKKLLNRTEKKQVDLARALNLPRQTISKMLSGTRTITAAELKIIADFFEVSMEALMENPVPDTKTDILERFSSGTDSEEARNGIQAAGRIMEMYQEQRKCLQKKGA